MNIRMVALAALLVPLAGPVLAQDRSMTVHKDPNCGCCTAWVEHMRKAGFTVNVTVAVLMSPLVSVMV